MDLQLNHQHVLITGGSKGIGLACAETFLTEGARVTLVSRDRANLDAAVKTLSAHHPAASIHTIAADLREAASGLAVLDNAEAHFGAVDVLVNSAGAAKRTPPEELNPQVWHDAMQAKYFSYIHMIVSYICLSKVSRKSDGLAIAHTAGIRELSNNNAPTRFPSTSMMFFTLAEQPLAHLPITLSTQHGILIGVMGSRFSRDTERLCERLQPHLPHFREE